MEADEKKRICRDIEKLERAKEGAIASAALDGKMWKSLGSKENMKQQIKVNKYCHELSIHFCKVLARKTGSSEQ